MTDKPELKPTIVKISINNSKMDMTFYPDDDELVEVTIIWITKKLKAVLKHPNPRPEQE